LKAVFY